MYSLCWDEGGRGGTITTGYDFIRSGVGMAEAATLICALFP